MKTGNDREPVQEMEVTVEGSDSECELVEMEDDDKHDVDCNQRTCSPDQWSEPAVEITFLTNGQELI